MGIHIIPSRCCHVTIWLGLQFLLVAGGPTPLESHYEVLGIQSDAPQEEVKKAYRRMALLEHPDKSDKPDAEERFRRIAGAFEILGDVMRRKQYDFDLEHGTSSSVGSHRSGSWADPYEMFRTHVGDVFQHWKPGYKVEGDLMQNQKRIHIVIFPDGASETEEVGDSHMHLFQKVGDGWCMFYKEPQMMYMEGKTEVDCRQRCVEMRPHCEGYSFAQPEGEQSAACEVYKREEAGALVKLAPPDKKPGVVCFQQDDNAFDTLSNVMESVITITHPDGTRSGITSQMFCSKTERTSRSQGIDRSEDAPSISQPWWVSWPASIASSLTR